MAGHPHARGEEGSIPFFLVKYKQKEKHKYLMFPDRTLWRNARNQFMHACSQSLPSLLMYLSYKKKSRQKHKYLIFMDFMEEIQETNASMHPLKLILVFLHIYHIKKISPPSREPLLRMAFQSLPPLAVVFFVRIFAPVEMSGRQPSTNFCQIYSGALLHSRPHFNGKSCLLYTSPSPRDS